MKLAVNPKKYRKSRRILLLSTSFIIVTLILFIIINIKQNSFTPVKFVPIIGLTLLSIAFSLFLRFLLRLKNYQNEAIELENNLLIIRSGIFGKREVDIREIESIKMREISDSLQYTIIINHPKRSKIGLVNQLKGYDVFVTDFIFDRNELNQFFDKVYRQIKK